MAGGCDFVAMDVLQFGAGFDGECVLRIEAEEVLIGGFCAGQIAEIALVDFGFGEERSVAEAGGGILMAEEFVLADGVAEGFLIFEDAAFFREEVGDGGNGGVGFGRGGIAVVDGTVGVKNALVLEPGALLLRAAFQSFLEALGVGESGRGRLGGGISGHRAPGAGLRERRARGSDCGDKRESDDADAGCVRPG